MMEPRPEAGPGGEATAACAALLREEIDFWAGMLEAAGDAVPAASIERMTFALALAEFRLHALLDAREEAVDRLGTVLPFTTRGD